MDDVDGKAMPGDAVEEGLDRGLVAVRAARRQPQAERPVGEGRRTPGEGRIGGQDPVRRRAMEDVDIQGWRLRLEGPGLEGRDAQVPGDAGAGRQEHAEAAAAPEEGHVLVRALARRAEGVDGPGDDALAGLVQPGELLAEAVEALAGARLEGSGDRGDAAVGPARKPSGGAAGRPSPSTSAGLSARRARPSRSTKRRPKGSRPISKPSSGPVTTSRPPRTLAVRRTRAGAEDRAGAAERSAGPTRPGRSSGSAREARRRRTRA